jgi:hypothetical protein
MMGWRLSHLTAYALLGVDSSVDARIKCISKRVAAARQSIRNSSTIVDLLKSTIFTAARQSLIEDRRSLPAKFFRN